MIDGVREWYRRLTADDVAHNRFVTPLRAVVRWTVVFYKQLERDRAFIRAAGMAYTTLIALVPLLLLAFGVLGAVGLLETEREAIETLLFGTVLGDIPQVRDFLLPGLMKVDLGALGAVGVIGLLVVASRLYILVERAYNDIYGVPVDRPFTQRILNFYFAVTALPLLGVAGLVTARDALSRVEGAGRFLAAWVVPLTLFVVFLAAIKLFPSTRVRWRAAIAGAAVSAVLVHLAGKIFPWYVTVFASDDPLRVIYGSLGILPVFLFWLYLLWIFVLLGVEVAYVTQNYRGLLQLEQDQVDLARVEGRSIDVGVAVEVAVRVAGAFQAGRAPVTVDVLADEGGFSSRDLRYVLKILEGSGVLVRTRDGWTLGLPPEAVPLARVVEAWRRATTVRKRGDDPIGDAVTAGVIGALPGTLADGVARWFPAEGEAEVRASERPTGYRVRDPSEVPP